MGALHGNYLSAFQFCNRNAVSVASPVNIVDSTKAVEWLHKFDAAFPRLEKITKNGLYSLVEKELKALTPILKEGQLISSSVSHFLPTTAMIDQLIKPRLSRLSIAYDNAQRTVVENSAVKELDVKIEKKWEKLGLPPSILESHADCARFLVRSGIAFNIVGYRETCGNADVHDVKLDHDGHPMIKVQGVFKRWDLIKQQLTYDEKSDKVLSIFYPGSIAQGWSYLHPSGLEPKDRLNNDRIVPFYRITNDERNRVATHAQKFYEKNDEVDVGVRKDWVVQFHTSPRRQYVSSMPPIPQNPLLDNVVRNLNTHIVMRLIAPNGDVYSSGLEMDLDSQNFLWENGLAKFLGTVTAQVNKTGDYEEFRPHTGRLVTSIPLTSQRADNIVNFLNDLGDVRFNFLRQNCSNLMGIVSKMAGYDIPMQTTVKETLIDMLPDLKYIPVIGPAAHKVNQVFLKFKAGISYITPGFIKNVVTLISDVVFFIPRKMATFAINLIIKYFGGATMLHALPENTEEEELYNAGRFLNFSRLIRGWTDLFKEQTQEVYHSKYFVEWQKEQKSTVLHPSSDRPKLAIVPPIGV